MLCFLYNLKLEGMLGFLVVIAIFTIISIVLGGRGSKIHILTLRTAPVRTVFLRSNHIGGLSVTGRKSKETSSLPIIIHIIIIIGYQNGPLIGINRYQSPLMAMMGIAVEVAIDDVGILLVSQRICGSLEMGLTKYVAI